MNWGVIATIKAVARLRRGMASLSEASGAAPGSGTASTGEIIHATNLSTCEILEVASIFVGNGLERTDVSPGVLACLAWLPQSAYGCKVPGNSMLTVAWRRVKEMQNMRWVLLSSI